MVDYETDKPDYQRRDDESHAAFSARVSEEFNDYVDCKNDEFKAEMQTKLDAMFRKVFIVCGGIAAACAIGLILLKVFGGA